MRNHYGFTALEDLIKKMAAYPRRIIPVLPFLDDIRFVADDGGSFTLSLDDYKKTEQCYWPNDVPHQVAFFMRALDSGKIDEWCEGLNYGKPDFITPNG